MPKKYTLLSIKESTRNDKKLMAIFLNNTTNRIIVTHFGAKNYSDYTLHKDPKRKKRYILRHSTREDWKNPVSAGALSRWILWNKKTLEDSILSYKRRFNFNHNDMYTL
jgi:hypothetical protein